MCNLFHREQTRFHVGRDIIRFASCYDFTFLSRLFSTLLRPSREPKDTPFYSIGSFVTCDVRNDDE